MPAVRPVSVKDVDAVVATFAPSRYTVYEAAPVTAFHVSDALLAVTPVTFRPAGAGSPVPPPGAVLSSPQNTPVW